MSQKEKEADVVQQSAILYVGLPIIAHKNFSRTVDGISEMMCVNSEAFVIHSLKKDLLVAVSQRPDGEHSFTINQSEFHDYFLLNYCSTTHKQQGATIDSNIVIFDYWFMTKELRYTALTRAKRLAQIGIFRGSL
jgi:ATP-dependent exoDNAse (exonuclease V) alpha subunit